MDKYLGEIADCDVLIRSFWLAQLPQKNELGVHVFSGSNDSLETVKFLFSFSNFKIFNLEKK